MKIAVCDDNAQDMAQIKDIMNALKGQFDIEILYFGSGEEVIAAAEKGAEISLVILDIYMGGLDGIKTACRLREILPNVQTAFITSSIDHAVDAFDVGALHYIVKPVTEEKLEEVINRFFVRVRSTLQKFDLKSKTKTYTFPVSRVQKIRSDNKGVDVYLKDSENPVHIPESFLSIEEQLDPSRFLKISRGFIVNMSYILCIDRDICRFRDGTEALISRREKDEIRCKYNDYLFGSQG